VQRLPLVAMVANLAQKGWKHAPYHSKSLFNKLLNRGRSVVENVFRILKKTFKKLLLKTYLNILFVLMWWFVVVFFTT